MGSLAILAPSTPSSENCESMMICMFATLRKVFGRVFSPCMNKNGVLTGINSQTGAQGAGLADDLSAQGSGLL